MPFHLVPVVLQREAIGLIEHKTVHIQMRQPVKPTRFHCLDRVFQGKRGKVVKGVTLEYSGPFLGLIEIAHFYEFAFFFGLMMAFWHTSIIIGLIVAFAGLVFMTVLDNSFARLTPNWMLRFMWTVPLSMALANLIWLWVK